MTTEAETPADRARAFVTMVFAAEDDPNSVDLVDFARLADEFLILSGGTTDPFLTAMRHVALAAFELGTLSTYESRQKLQLACRAASMVSALFPKH